MLEQKPLSVYYDDQCAFCCYCVQWLKRQAKFIEIYFFPYSLLKEKMSHDQYSRWGLEEKELIVLRGNAIYKQNKALLMCLYALVNYREWSFRLSTPVLLPKVKNVYRFISSSRCKLSILLQLKDEGKISKVLDCYAGDKPCDSNVINP